MPLLDWAGIAVLVISLLLGAMRGLVYEVFSAAGWVAAFLCAQWLAADVGAWLPIGGAGMPWSYPAGFVLVFIAVAFVGGLVAWAFRRLTVAAGLRPVDRSLGAAFGVVRGALVLLVVGVMVHLLSVASSPLWRESQGAALVEAGLQAVKPTLPEKLASYLP